MRMQRNAPLEGLTGRAPTPRLGRPLFVYSGGPHLQSGRGFFSSLVRVTGLFRRAAPLARRAVSSQAVQDIGKAAVEHGAAAAAGAVADLVEGKSPKGGVGKHLASARQDIAESIRSSTSSLDRSVGRRRARAEPVQNDSDSPVLFDDDSDYDYYDVEQAKRRRKARRKGGKSLSVKLPKRQMSREKYLTAKKPKRSERKGYGRFK